MEVIEEILFHNGIRNHHVTIKKIESFYRAEEYHQKFYLKNAKGVYLEMLNKYGSDLEIDKSIEALKINSILGGYKPKNFDYDSYNLASEIVEYLKIHTGDNIGMHEKK